jgi:hypothetical protein
MYYLPLIDDSKWPNLVSAAATQSARAVSIIENSQTIIATLRRQYSEVNLDELVKAQQKMLMATGEWCGRRGVVCLLLLMRRTWMPLLTRQIEFRFSGP